MQEAVLLSEPPGKHSKVEHFRITSLRIKGIPRFVIYRALADNKMKGTKMLPCPLPFRVVAHGVIVQIDLQFAKQTCLLLISLASECRTVMNIITS